MVIAGIMVVYAQTGSKPNPGHNPSEIGPGTFSVGSGGDFIFPNKVKVHTQPASGLRSSLVIGKESMQTTDSEIILAGNSDSHNLVIDNLQGLGIFQFRSNSGDLFVGFNESGMVLPYRGPEPTPSRIQFLGSPPSTATDVAISNFQGSGTLQIRTGLAGILTANPTQGIGISAYAAPGQGNAYICVTEGGLLFRSETTCPA